MKLGELVNLIHFSFNGRKKEKKKKGKRNELFEGGNGSLTDGSRLTMMTNTVFIAKKNKNKFLFYSYFEKTFWTSNI